MRSFAFVVGFVTAVAVITRYVPLAWLLAIIAFMCLYAIARYIAPGITEARRTGNTADVWLYVKVIASLLFLAGTCLFGLVTLVRTGAA